MKKFLTLYIVLFQSSLVFSGEALRTQHFQGNTLRVEAVGENTIRFQYSKGLNAPGIWEQNPMLSAQRRFTNSNLRWRGERLSLRSGDLILDPKTGCLRAVSRETSELYTEVCPHWAERGSLTLTQESTRDIYGLGEQFLNPGKTDGNWMGKVRTQGKVGNEMVGFHGGAVGNALFPVMYALGEGNSAYALFVDQFEKQEWNFEKDPFVVKVDADTIQGFLIFGKDLSSLRKQYLQLVGRPPVPPKKAFGLWVSEYGFDNWGELDEKFVSLRRNQFPVDGFVMDLQWFGGIRSESDNSPMGSLTWDRKNFPSPERKIQSLRNQGVGLVAIEESYISRGLREHRVLESRGFLAKEGGPNGAPSYIVHNPWWGKGGMIDWTNPYAGNLWHDWKRQALVNMGIMGHWTDLGEPEMYHETSWYWGFPSLGKHQHKDIHDAFNLLWSQSIFRGYQRHRLAQRPWILSRSGTSGSQRFGVTMWSGDIGSNLESLSSHLNAQMHMSLSGVDYFGSDAGGFHRKSVKGDENEMYTQWFAASAMLDVPLRPHTLNLCNCFETSPDRVGHLASNRENLRLRYRLIPYLYSLAHRASLWGEPIFPPLVYHFQDDLNVRTLGSQKMIGSQLMVALAAEHGRKEMDVYLPQGDWFDYRTGVAFGSSGQWLKSVSLYDGDNYQLPLFARAGSIIPTLKVDGETWNSLGQTAQGKREELRLRVFLGNGEFTLFEDDGATVAYQGGRVRRSTFKQTVNGSVSTLTGTTRGFYPGMARRRPTVVEFVTPYVVNRITASGRELKRLSDSKALAKASRGWTREKSGLLVLKLGTTTRLPSIRIEQSSEKIYRGSDES